MNKIYTGNSIEIMDNFKKEIFDLIVTSPPYSDMVYYGDDVDLKYGEKYIDELYKIFEKSSHLLKSTGSLILNINDRLKEKERTMDVFKLIIKITECSQLKLFDRYIWRKKTSIPNKSLKRLNDNMEYIFHFVKDVDNFKGNAYNLKKPVAYNKKEKYRQKITGTDGILVYKEVNTRMPGKYAKHKTILDFPTAAYDYNEKFHPAPFSIKLPDFFIKYLTEENDIVFDMFMGSGSTAIAAINNNRKYIGIDINDNYVKLANKRILEQTNIINKQNEQTKLKL